MKRSVFSFIAILALFSVVPTSASAGVYTDDLSKCLVASTTEQDRKDLILWVFSAMSHHPSVAPFAKFSTAQRIEITKKAASLFVRLLTDDCKTQTKQAVQYEGSSALEQSFTVLGQVAMRSLMSDQTVAKDLSELDQYLDMKKLQETLDQNVQGTVPPRK